MAKNLKANGLNHLALSTSNMKEQIAFFTDVLGMELVALYWMHGVEGCWHGFLKLNESSTVAFVFNPANEGAKISFGVTQPLNMFDGSAPGTMQHLALNVDSLEDVLNMRDRIRSRGVYVFGPLDHGFCHSIYFQGPEGLNLEIATFGDVEHPIGPKDWIDQEVVDLAGITPEELETYIKPAVYSGEGGNIPQPEYNSDGHSPTMPDDALKELYSMPDAVVTTEMSEATPPSKMNKHDRDSKHLA